jgi:hypothetical protein
MGKFFEELATKLADRWAALLLLPGALFLAVGWLGGHLGHRHALDLSLLQQTASQAWAAIAHQSAGTQVVLALAVLLISAGVGMAVQALAGVTRLIWLGPWPLLNRWRAGRRRARWLRLVRRRHALESQHPRESRTPEQQRAIDRAADRVNRLALAEPGRPTWMGDRIHAVERIARDRCGLDLTFAWPRLWLVFPENTRTELTAAHAAFAAAVATGTWAWPYLLLATLWWPAVLIGIGIGCTGWVKARSAIADLTDLSEAALDLHGRTLAIELDAADPDATGPLTIAEGEKLTAMMRKGR